MTVLWLRLQWLLRVVCVVKLAPKYKYSVDPLCENLWQGFAALVASWGSEHGIRCWERSLAPLRRYDSLDSNGRACKRCVCARFDEHRKLACGLRLPEAGVLAVHGRIASCRGMLSDLVRDRLQVQRGAAVPRLLDPARMIGFWSSTVAPRLLYIAHMSRWRSSG